MSLIYKLTAKVAFPEGAAPGAGGSANRQIIARDGRGNPLIRGSALAGVLRRAYGKKIEKAALLDKVAPDKATLDKAVCRWFGEPLDETSGRKSPVRVADARFTCGEINERTHNMVIRHTGAVADKGLFSLEAVPPGATAKVSLTLFPDPEDAGSSRDFLMDIAGILAGDLLVGGGTNRGIGRMTMVGKASLSSFAGNTLDGLADFLDAQYQERRQGISPQEETLDPPTVQDRLVIQLELGIPRGEDLLVGDGQEADHALEPQSVLIGGKAHWRIPGSSLRGIFRAWMSRLAAREIASGELEDSRILDAVQHWSDGDGTAYDPHLAGLGFAKTKEEQEIYKATPKELKDPVMDLFGSSYHKGRIHITDALTREAAGNEAQERMHVAVDRISGGAHEGALFKTRVLTGDHLRFPVTITLESPSSKEVDWLNRTLKALHLGILLVGSSKGSGRLEIKTLTARGPLAGAVTPYPREEN